MRRILLGVVAGLLLPLSPAQAADLDQTASKHVKKTIQEPVTTGNSQGQGKGQGCGRGLYIAPGQTGQPVSPPPFSSNAGSGGGCNSSPST